MKINFYPDSDKENLVIASTEYTKIWNESGLKIVESYEKATGLNFIENEINAIIFEKPSFSHPLTLRASYSIDIKKGTLIHELGHRLIVGNKVEVEVTKENVSLSIHKQLFLVLFSVWEDLFGGEFAQQMVTEERKRGEVYEEAWNWALSFKKEEQKRLFNLSISDKALNF